MNIYTVFLFYFLTLISFPLFAETLTVSEDREYNLAPHLEIFETQLDSTVEEAVKNGKFIKNKRESLDRGMSENHFWLKFTIKNNSPAQFWYLSLSANQLDTVGFYFKDEKGNFVKHISGDHRPFSEWSEPYPNPVFKFYLKEGEEKIFHVHIKSTSVISFNTSIFGKISLTENQIYKNMLQLIYFIITLLYIAFLIYLRKRTGNENYLFLIPLSVLYFLYIFFISGNSYQFWPNSPYIQDRSLVMTAVLFLLIVIYFIRSFLQLKLNHSLLNKVFIFAWLLTLLGLFFLYKINIFMQKWLFFHGLFVYALIFAATVRVYVSGQKYVRYLLVLWILIGSGIVIRILALMNIMPYNTWTYHAVAIHYPFALLLIIKTAYDKYNLLVKEKIELEFKYTELLKSLGETKRIVRIKGLDVEKIKNKIEMMVKEDVSFYDPDFDLNKLASKLEIRQDQLSQILNQELNISFKKLINTIRIHKICELMKISPEKTITEIFLECGYSSKNPFNSAFREIMDMSPTEYRLSQQSNKCGPFHKYS